MPGAGDSDVEQAHGIRPPSSAQEGSNLQTRRLDEIANHNVEFESLEGMHRPNPTVDLQIHTLNPLFEVVALGSVGGHDADIFSIPLRLGYANQDLLRQEEVNVGVILVVAGPPAFRLLGSRQPGISGIV